MYPVYDLSDSIAQRPEALGSKEKMWLVPHTQALPLRHHLFKLGRAGTGENWSEKASCEIAKLLQLPTADYQLAVAGSVRGILTERFMADGAAFLPGNTLLARVIDGYDGSKRFKQIEYTLSAILSLLSRIRALRVPTGTPDSQMTAQDLFIGYLVFDVLIGNTDRHHENWGIVLTPGGDRPVFSLAPTFDHASSLGRELTDEMREFRLTTADQRATVEAYAARTRTAFFSDGSVRPMTSREMLQELSRLYPRQCRHWCGRISDIDPADFESVFTEIPNDWISQPAIDFAMELLRINHRLLRDYAHG